MKTAPSSDNVLLGKGALYMDILSNGARTGEFHLGNCTRGEISQTDEMKQLYSSMSAANPLYKETLGRRTVTLAITGNEFSPEAMKLIFMGSDITVTQAGGTTSDASLTTSAVQGRYYDVGKRQISNVTVKYTASNTVATVTTDYTIDAARGRIYLVPGGGIANGDPVLVTYTANALANATALPAIAGGTVTTFSAYIRFVGDPSAGPAMEVEIWKASVSREGAVGLIADDWGNWSLNCKCEDDSTNHATAPYFRVIRPTATDAA